MSDLAKTLRIEFCNDKETWQKLLAQYRVGGLDEVAANLNKAISIIYDNVENTIVREHGFLWLPVMRELGNLTGKEIAIELEPFFVNYIEKQDVEYTYDEEGRPTQVVVDGRTFEYRYVQ